MLDDLEGRSRQRLIVGLLGMSLVLAAMLLGLLWLRAHCDSCDQATLAADGAATTTTTPAASVTTTATTRPPTTVGSTTSTSVPPVTVGEFCVTGVRSSEALNVRAGPGESNAVIGTFPFSASGILGTGSAQDDDQGRIWYEVFFDGAFTGRAWVASWLLVEAPCGPYAAFDVAVSGNGREIEVDPGEWVSDPVACGDAGACFVNRDADDRETMVLAGDLKVYLIGRDLADLPPITVAEFTAYLQGDGYDSDVHFYEPSYQCTTTCATGIRFGQPYHLFVEGGEVVRIEQVFTP